MLLTLDVFKDLLGTIALMALLGVAYGTAMRSFGRAAPAQLALGALFGSVAVLAMLDPIRVAPGTIVDMRNVPVILAGAFLGLPGMVVTVILALGARIGIGGVGMPAGVTGIVISGATGFAWALFVRGLPRRHRRNALHLAGLSLLHLAVIVLLPRDIAWLTVLTVWPFFVPLHFVGVLLLSLLLERERLIAEDESRKAPPPVPARPTAL